MEQNSTKEVGAEVSIYENGMLYVGVEARRKLKAGLDDKVKVEIPELGRVVDGALNSGHQISAGKEVARSAFNDTSEERNLTRTHVEAIVKRVPGTWDDDHGLTDERHDGTNSLGSKDL